MHAHKKPTFSYDVILEDELKQVREWRKKKDRIIPPKTDNNLLVATWNLTNFGLQKRKAAHLEIMAEILKPFDVVAVQEVADNLKDLSSLLSKLGSDWDTIYTDIAGNKERLAYLFDTRRVSTTGLFAELAMRSYERQRVVIEEIGEDFKGFKQPEEFGGFNRNPYIVGFKAGQFEFYLINVHLYWSSFQLRCLEAQALSEWAKRRVEKRFPPNNDIILIGDFNMPKVSKGDLIFNILKNNGLQIPKHSTNFVGTNLAGDNDYDEIAFFPGKTKNDYTGKMGVFDFDNTVFKDLWSEKNKKRQKKFFQYVRYYIADHRPLWAEFQRKAH